MKHRGVTPLRWLSRLPGRIYRNKAVRFLTLGVLGYQIAFQIAWRLAGKPHQDVMNGFAWLLAIGIYLALVVFNWAMHRSARKYWREGHEKYDLALATLTMATHGRYNAHRDGDTYDVACACGTYLGSVKAMAPNEIMPLLEGHTTAKIQEVKDEVERKTRASAGSR